MKCMKIMPVSSENSVPKKNNINFRNRNESDPNKSCGSSGTHYSGMYSIQYKFNKYDQPLEEREVFVGGYPTNKTSFERFFDYYDDGKVRSIKESGPGGIMGPYRTRYIPYHESVYYPPDLTRVAKAVFPLTNIGNGVEMLTLTHFYIKNNLYDQVCVYFKKGLELPYRIFASASSGCQSVDYTCKEGIENAFIRGNTVFFKELTKCIK